MNQLERDFRAAFGIENDNFIPPLEAFGIDGKGTMAKFIAEMEPDMLEGLAQAHPHHMIRNLAARALKAERALSDANAKATAWAERFQSQCKETDRVGSQVLRATMEADAAMTYAELTTRKALKVLDTCAILDCACTLRERESGHRVGCAVPHQREALNELRAVLRRDGEARTEIQGAIIDEPNLDAMIERAFPKSESEIGTGNPKTVGRCATTQTERYRVEGCTCETYPGNEGLPCLTWSQSRAADRCAYCDHNLECHRRLSAMFKGSHAVGTGWVAFADREPPWDPEHGVQFAMMLCAKGGRVELDTAIHRNYAQACRFTYWRPLSEVVLSQVSKREPTR